MGGQAGQFLLDVDLRRVEHQFLGEAFWIGGDAGIGQTGPAGNYQGLTDLQTWICTVAMLLGRLEIFSVLILFTAAFWRK